MRFWRKWLIESHTKPGKFYIVAEGPSGFSCSCPQWKFRRRTCKHIIEVQSGGGVEVLSDVTQKDLEAAISFGGLAHALATYRVLL